MVLVDTEAAVVAITRSGATAEELSYWRRVIYNKARLGQITNYGGPGKGQALWNLEEIKKIRRGA